MASGINSTFRQAGIATGIAGLGAVFQHEITARTLSGLARSGQGPAVLASTHGALRATLASGTTGTLARSLPPGQRVVLVHAFRAGFAGALNEILIIAAAIALVGAICGFVLVRGRDFVVAHGAPTTPALAPGPGPDAAPPPPSLPRREDAFNAGSPARALTRSVSRGPLLAALLISVGLGLILRLRRSAGD